jgi:hypothetical protein
MISVALGYFADDLGVIGDESERHFVDIFASINF